MLEDPSMSRSSQSGNTEALGVPELGMCEFQVTAEWPGLVKEMTPFVSSQAELYDVPYSLTGNGVEIWLIESSPVSPTTVPAAMYAVPVASTQVLPKASARCGSVIVTVCGPLIVTGTDAGAEHWLVASDA